MPELPDLEVFSANLQKQLSSKVLKEVNTGTASKLKLTNKELKEAFNGAKLSKVYREGKELRFAFSNRNILGMHLMLNGKLLLGKEEAEQKSTIISLDFGDEHLTLTDFRKLATVVLNPEESIAPDALAAEVNYNFLREALQSKKAIKSLLLDQKIIRGIGNAYADEILWSAKIDPSSLSNKIPDDKIKILAASIKSVLKKAITQIRKHHPDIIAGEVRDFLIIHNAKQDKSPTGAEIKTKTINSRTTYYTNEQELYE